MELNTENLTPEQAAQMQCLMPTAQQEVVMRIKSQQAQQTLSQLAKKAVRLPTQLNQQHFRTNIASLSGIDLLQSLLAELNQKVMAQTPKMTPKERVIAVEYAKCMLKGEATRQILMRTQGSLGIRLEAATKYAYDPRVKLEEKLNLLSYMLTDPDVKDTCLSKLKLNIPVSNLQTWLSHLLLVRESSDETTHLIHSHQLIVGAENYLTAYQQKENYIQ